MGSSPVSRAAGESGCRDLNPGPPAPKAGALPSCATARFYDADRQYLSDQLATPVSPDHTCLTHSLSPAVPLVSLPADRQDPKRYRLPQTRS
jgi:hypothetical protein